jgi:rod shape determining protein RodA
MLQQLRQQKYKRDSRYHDVCQVLHIDIVLLSLLLLLACIGLFVLYSASEQHGQMVEMQCVHLLFGFVLMFIFAQIPPTTLQRWAVPAYGISCFLLVAVLIIGHTGKGAQRWLNLGVLHLQPAELMKLTVPLILAWYYHHHHLPIQMKSLLVALPLMLIPAVLTAKQPDLGTAILIFLSGMSVLFLAGLPMRTIGAAVAALIISAPLVWYRLHDYQRNRVLTFLNPERDPLGAGYHIIQSKIAIGSGGFFGKGWLNGTQSSLHFLPEHTTDFIFAVCGEEFGFAGCILILTVLMLIVCRGFYITLQAQDTFSRLLAGSLTLVFFISFFINVSMVTGLLPVVGVPLPLISYGGSSVVTMMASFGMLMSIQTHRRLITT